MTAVFPPGAVEAFQGMTGIQYWTPIESPSCGSVEERRALHTRLEKRLSVDSNLTRRVVSYQGNREAPGFRWLKYTVGRLLRRSTDNTC